MGGFLPPPASVVVDIPAIVIGTVELSLGGAVWTLTSFHGIDAATANSVNAVRQGVGAGYIEWDNISPSFFTPLIVTTGINNLQVTPDITVSLGTGVVGLPVPLTGQYFSAYSGGALADISFGVLMIS